jgi:hypothetical protein
MIVEIVSTVGQETQERPRKSPRFSLKKTSAEGRYDSEYHRDYMQDGLDESNQGDWYPGDKRPPYRTNRARYMNNREYDDNGYDPYYTEHSSHQNGRGHYFQMNLNSIGIDDQSRERNVKRLLIKGNSFFLPTDDNFRELDADIQPRSNVKKRHPPIYFARMCIIV